MNILPNGVAVTGTSHHVEWCAKDGLVHDKWMECILKSLISERNIKVAVNAGGHIGTLARVLLDAGCEVHAFEPNSDAVECLEHNCPEANIYRVALSEFSGDLPFTRCDNAGASYVSPAGKAAPGAVFVRSRPLDDYDLNPDFMLLDAEGFEVAILRGAKKTIEKFRPVIICEVNAGALERAGECWPRLCEQLHEMGYKNLSILQPDCKFGDPQFDLLCLP